MGCYSGIGVIILLYFVVFVLNIVKTPKQMNCFGVLQRFQSSRPTKGKPDKCQVVKKSPPVVLTMVGETWVESETN